MVAFAAEAEGRSQTGLGEKFVFLADEFGKNLLPGLYGDDVRQPDNPDLSRVAGLTESLHTMDVEQLRVDRSLVQAEKELFYALLRLSSFHSFLENEPVITPTSAIIRAETIKSINLFAQGAISYTLRPERS